MEGCSEIPRRVTLGRKARTSQATRRANRALFSLFLQDRIKNRPVSRQRRRGRISFKEIYTGRRQRVSLRMHSQLGERFAGEAVFVKQMKKKKQKEERRKTKTQITRQRSAFSWSSPHSLCRQIDEVLTRATASCLFLSIFWANGRYIFPSTSFTRACKYSFHLVQQICLRKTSAEFSSKQLCGRQLDGKRMGASSRCKASQLSSLLLRTVCRLKFQRNKNDGR